MKKQQSGKTILCAAALAAIFIGQVHAQNVGASGPVESAPEIGAAGAYNLASPDVVGGLQNLFQTDIGANLLANVPSLGFVQQMNPVAEKANPQNKADYQKLGAILADQKTSYEIAKAVRTRADQVIRSASNGGMSLEEIDKAAAQLAPFSAIAAKSPAFSVEALNQIERVRKLADAKTMEEARRMALALAPASEEDSPLGASRDFPGGHDVVSAGGGNLGTVKVPANARLKPASKQAAADDANVQSVPQAIAQNNASVLANDGWLGKVRDFFNFPKPLARTPSLFDLADASPQLERSPDGKQIATLSDGTVLDVETGTKLRFNGSVKSLKWSSDGKQIATVIDYPERSPDGKQVVAAKVGTVTVWDAKTGLVLYKLPEAKPIEWDASKMSLAWGDDGKVKVVNVPTAAAPQTLGQRIVDALKQASAPASQSAAPKFETEDVADYALQRDFGAALDINFHEGNVPYKLSGHGVPSIFFDRDYYPSRAGYFVSLNALAIVKASLEAQKAPAALKKFSSVLGPLNKFAGDKEGMRDEFLAKIGELEARTPVVIDGKLYVFVGPRIDGKELPLVPLSADDEIPMPEIRVNPMYDQAQLVGLAGRSGDKFADIMSAPRAYAGNHTLAYNRKMPYIEGQEVIVISGGHAVRGIFRGFWSPGEVRGYPLRGRVRGKLDKVARMYFVQVNDAVVAIDGNDPSLRIFSTAEWR